MGMLDSELVLSSAQAPTAVGDTPSTNVYDSGSAYSNAQNCDESMVGENVYANVICNTVPTSGGAATIQAVLQDSPDNATWTDRLIGPSFGYAAVTKGLALLQTPSPMFTQRYQRIVYRIGTAVLTAGAFDAYFSNTIPRNIQRPTGFTVS
jgi:hypothetical protein